MKRLGLRSIVNPISVTAPLLTSTFHRCWQKIFNKETNQLSTHRINIYDILAETFLHISYSVQKFCKKTQGNVFQHGVDNLGYFSADRICRRRLSIFGHVRRLPEAKPAHSALRLAVDTHAGGEPDIRPEWKRQRRRPCRTWVQQIEDDTGLNANTGLEDRTWPHVLEGATTRGRSSVPVSECAHQGKMLYEVVS